MQKLRFGILSTAAITSRFIAAVQESPHCEVIGIASRNLEKANVQASRFCIPHVYGSYQELYQDEEVDILYIATNNGSHLQNIKDALSYGLHVLCEKPLALSQQEAETVFALAKEKQCFLMEAQKSVFLPVTLLIKDYIDQAKLGYLKQVELTASFDSPRADWMHEEHQGGVVYGSASYTIEYLDFLIDPKHICMAAMGTREKNHTIDAICMSFAMDDVIISSNITMRNKTDNLAIFYFEQGKIEVKDFWKARSCRITNTQGTEEKYFPVTYEMIYEIAHVYRCMQKQMLNSDIMSKKRTITCTKLVDEIVHKANF